MKRRLRRLALPASAALLLGLLAVLAGCSTLPADRITQSAGEKEAAALDVLALRLLDRRLSPDAGRLQVLRADLDREAARPGWSRSAQARVNALRAEAALQAGDRTAAKSLADAALRLSDAEEGLWFVRAELEPDAARRLALLSEGLSKSQSKGRLLCERGRELLKAGKYAQAAQDLDEGLRALDPAYRALYGPDRDQALALAQAAREAGSAAALGKPESLEGQLSLRGMVERAFRETKLLSSLSSNPAPTYAVALPAVQAAGLLLDPAAPPESAATRKAVAFFLWGLIARTEHDPKLLTQYRRKYSLSPVPDVGLEDPWFDAVLGVVERELMDLPDGVNFQPDQPVGGLEYLSILQRLQRLFR